MPDTKPSHVCQPCWDGDHSNHRPNLGGICIGCSCEGEGGDSSINGVFVLSKQRCDSQSCGVDGEHSHAVMVYPPASEGGQSDA